MLMHCKRIKLLSTVTLFFLLLSLISSASSPSKVHNWSIKRQKNGIQPIIEKQLSFCDNYDFAYLDNSANEKDKVIYLTFDAGYENGNVEKIVNILNKHNAKGAFFILDNVIKRNTDLIISMAKNGHLICNHTAKHTDITKLTTKEALHSELKKLEEVYTQFTGETMSKFFRPPEGKFSEDNLKHLTELGYKTVFWSFAYADWDNNKQPSREYAAQLILDNTHNGMIILLHPTSATNAQILDELLTRWEEQGYRFGTLNEL